MSVGREGTARTLFDKLWRAHAVGEFAGDRAALVIDRVMLHEISGGYALRDMLARDGRPRLPTDQLLAVADHAISTRPDRAACDSPCDGGSEMIRSLQDCASALGIRYADPRGPDHGIVHVIAPEQGFVLPGVTLVCGDSHTCTNGAFGALAFAAGSTEIATVLDHGALIVQRPKTIRLSITGELAKAVFAKDLALALLSAFGTAFARGHAIEFTGPTVRAMSMEPRMTLCNMAAEMGTRYAMIAPDGQTLDYLRQQPLAGERLGRTATADWSGLRSDDGARYDRELSFDAETVTPMVSWGTTPAHAVSVGECVPDPTDLPDSDKQRSATAALEYMGLRPGTPLRRIAIDAAFIGSCTNARIGDLRAAASVLRGRRVRDGVRAMCTPGSARVRAQAEAEGLDRVFTDAGFQWRASGCSNCAGREGPIWNGLRVVSSTNRNFENRQGLRTRTHLASPATVAASAIAGRITDPRQL